MVVNESDQPVWFDDLNLQIQESLVVQENHYDAFGLALSGIEKEGTPENKYKFNDMTERVDDLALNWDMTDYRSYDPQLGRFHQVDPLASLMPGINPYQYAYNNPIYFNDPLGLFADGGGSSGAANGKDENQAGAATSTAAAGAGSSQQAQDFSSFLEDVPSASKGAGKPGSRPGTGPGGSGQGPARTSPSGGGTRPGPGGANRVTILLSPGVIAYGTIALMPFVLYGDTPKRSPEVQKFNKYVSLESEEWYTRLSDLISELTNNDDEDSRKGVQYELVAAKDGEYPVLWRTGPQYGDVETVFIHLKEGETWKIGETIKYNFETGKQYRYSESLLESLGLKFVRKNSGTKPIMRPLQGKNI